MAIETDADRLEFFDADEFGTTAAVTLHGGGTFSIVGIFEAPFEGVDLAGVMLSQSAPTFLCRAADLGGITAKADDELEIDGTTYVVNEIKPDGTGLVTLVLLETA